MSAAVYARRADGGPDLRGNTADRRRRREWLISEWRADVDGIPIVDEYGDTVHVAALPWQTGEPACRCYRCGCLLTIDTVTVDRIDLGKNGGRYTRDNIRPACATCNKSTGATARWENEGRPE